MFLTDCGGNLSNRAAASGYVVRRQWLVGKVSMPQLSSDNIHIALHARELGFRFGQHALGIPTSVEHQFQLGGELLLPQPPIARSFWQNFFLEKGLILF